MDPFGRFLLRDGRVVGVRAVRPADRFALLEFLRGLCTDSRTSRFLAPCVDLERAAALLTDVDDVGRFGMVATSGAAGIVGHAGFARVAPGRAEAAVVVADAYRGRGLGTLLLVLVAGAAVDRGVDTFVAEVLSDNGAAVACIRKSFPLTVRCQPGTWLLEFPTRPLPAARPREPVVA